MSKDEELPKELQSLFEWLGLKNEPRTSEQIEGALDGIIDDKFTETDVIRAMKLIDKRVEERKRKDDKL